MDPEKWKRVEELFHLAIELPDSERIPFLSRECGGQAEIFEEVCSLLQHHDGPEEIINLDPRKALPFVLEQSRLSPGQIIDEYEVLSQLGSGATGEVYLANHQVLWRQVAIKILARPYASDPDLLQRLRAEAQAASALNHPNILTVHAFGQYDGSHFIVTEYVDGKSLRELVGSLSVSEAIQYAVQIGTALSVAHEAGILHRDIKPENVMVRDDGIIKVLDFGLATTFTPTPNASRGQARISWLHSAEGLVAGTVAYMSPEQIRGEPLHPTTDIWSWAVVFYELLTGRRPFQEDDKGNLIGAILNSTPPPPTDSRLLNQVLQRALEKDRQRRHQTMQAVLQDLSSAGGMLPTASTTIAISNAGRESSQPSRLRWRYLALILVLIGLTAAALPLLVRPKSYQVLSTKSINQRGDVASAAISSDGTRIAYAAEEGSSGTLHVLELDTTIDAERVRHYDGRNTGITFSPDGKYIYYVLQKNELGILYRVPLVGGEPKEILRNIDSPVTFSPDGSQFAFESCDGDNRICNIRIGNSEETHDVAAVPFPKYLESPLDWDPVGDAIMFGYYDYSVSGPGKLGYGALFPTQSKLEFGKPPTLHSSVALVSLSSDLLLIQAQLTPSDTARLFQLNWRTGDVRLASQQSNSFDTLSASADRRTIAAIQRVRQASVWLYSGNRVDRLTAPAGRFDGVSWDGSGHLLTGSLLDGKLNLWRINVSTRETDPVTEGDKSDMFPAASPSGNAIVFSSNRDGTGHIWRATRDGRSVSRLTSGSQIETDPALSADGRTVFFSSSRDGAMKLWKVSIAGGVPVKVSDVPARHPDISPDGKWIVCECESKAGGPWQVAVLDSTDGTFKTAFPKIAPASPDATDQGHHVRWSASSKSLIYVETVGGVSNFWDQPLNGGNPRQLTHFIEGTIFDFAPSMANPSIAFVKGNTGGDLFLLRGSYQ